MERFFHSVRLDADKCVGCTNCIKRCPTEAIRVRDGKAHIITERCIDCGECIKICPHHAKRPVFDPFSALEESNKKYKIALPAPALYGQYNNIDDMDIILTGLKNIGFDDVFEVSRGAELVSEATRLYMSRSDVKKPVISSACPAVVRLIRVRFPDLVDNVLPIYAPMEVAARIAKQEASKKTSIPVEDIGVYFITPCPAKVTDIKSPISMDKSWIDGSFAISDIYPRLLSSMKKVQIPEPLQHSGIIGVSWAGIGGEASALLRENHLAADGIENVASVLEQLEDEKLRELDFIELNACSGGCVGGVLTVENPYVAKARLNRLRKYLPVSCNHLDSSEIPDEMKWENKLKFSPVMNLSEDLFEAMEMMDKISKIAENFPGLDCGSCGAPSCTALAEDIVKGTADIDDCIFVMRRRIMNRFADYFSKKDEENDSEGNEGSAEPDGSC